MRTTTAAEVAYNVIDLFCLFGASSVLQSDNGREFVNEIIEQLKVMWPGLSIVHGEPRHTQSQGSVERANQDVEGMVQAWMADNQTKLWSEGLRFVQMQKNNSYHQGIKQSPFEAMFGWKMLFGINVPVLLTSITKTLTTEEDLTRTVSSIGSINTEVHNNDEGVVTGQEAVVTGDEGVVTGQEAVVTGDEGVVTGQEAVVTGDKGVVTGQEAVVTGDEEWR